MKSLINSTLFNPWYHYFLVRFNWRKNHNSPIYAGVVCDQVQSILSYLTGRLTIKLERVNCLPDFSCLNMESESISDESKKNIEFIPVLSFSYCGYFNRFQPSIVHHEERDASQAYRWTFRRLSLQVVHLRGRVPPPQQTLWTRLPGDRPWRHNYIWSSGSLRRVRKVQRTYRLVWVSSFMIHFPPEQRSIIGFGRPWIAVCTRPTSCFMHLRTLVKEKSLSMTSIVQPVGLWFPGHAITLREGNRTFSLLG